MVPLRFFNIYSPISTQPILTCKWMLQIGYIWEGMSPKQIHVQKMPFSLVCLAKQKKKEKKKEKQQLSISKCVKLYAIYSVKFTFLHTKKFVLLELNHKWVYGAVRNVNEKSWPSVKKTKKQMNRQKITSGPQC